MKALEKIIQGIISDKRNQKVVINNDGFLFGLFDRSDDGKKILFKRVSNLVLLLCCFITCIVILVESFVFYINDVLLFENKVFMNQQGAFVPTQSCDREYALFMFTSSDLWANTGVQVREGDRIKIMASGAFNSSVSDLVHRANSNKALKYGWIPAMPSDSIRNSEKVEQCIEKSAYFGAILYRIQNDFSSKINLEDIRMLPPTIEEEKQFIDIDRNGTLFFAVNDIYLTSSIIKEYEDANRELTANLLPRYGKDSIVIRNDQILIRKEIFEKYKDRITLFLYQGKDYVEVAGKHFKEYFEEHPTIWYDDNIGDLLICMEIEHVTKNSYAKWYRECEVEFNIVKDKRNEGISNFVTMIPKVIVWLGKAFYTFRSEFFIFLFIFILINFGYVYRLTKIYVKKLIRSCRNIIKQLN